MSENTDHFETVKLQIESAKREIQSALQAETPYQAGKHLGNAEHHVTMAETGMEKMQGDTTAN